MPGLGPASVYVEFHVQWVQIRSAHLRGPPQPRIREIQLGKLAGLESYVLGFSGREFSVLRKLDFLNVSLQRSLDGLIRRVLQLRCYCQLCAVAGRRHLGNYG